jgi:hypothetical protein
MSAQIWKTISILEPTLLLNGQVSILWHISVALILILQELLLLTPLKQELYRADKAVGAGLWDWIR